MNDIEIKETFLKSYTSIEAEKDVKEYLEKGTPMFVKKHCCITFRKDRKYDNIEYIIFVGIPLYMNEKGDISILHEHNFLVNIFTK